MVGENEALYATTELYRWGEKNHRCRLHIFYNAERAASDFDRLVRRLIACREKLLAGGAIEDINKNLQCYLIIRKTPKRGLQVDFNDEEIEKFRKKYSGFFCILSNTIKSPAEALSIYRN